MELLNTTGTDGLGPGVIPMVCLAGVFFLSFFVLVRSVFEYRKTSAAERCGDGMVYGLTTAQYLKVCGISILLIAVYTFLWKYTHFLVATSVFCCAMSLFVLQPEERTTGRIIKYFTGLICYAVFLWYAFETFLKVSLR